MISRDDVMLIQKRFSRASERYERLAFIQKDIRRELLGRLGDIREKSVLDVGCGTGALLSDLAEKDPLGYRVGMDLAQGMVDEARIVDASAGIVQADAAFLPFREKAFDLVVSSSSYQWVGDRTAALSGVRRVLKDDGGFHAAFFARGTLGEFFESLNRSRQHPLPILRLPSEEEVKGELALAGFRQAVMSVETREAVFRDLWTLLVWLKSIGANNLGRGAFLGREMLVRAQEYYSRCYGKDEGIRVSFEVIWIEARK